jgi:hypothetical protein
MAGTIRAHHPQLQSYWYGLSEAEQAEKRRRCQVVIAGDAGGVGVARCHVRGQHDFQQVEIWPFGTLQAALDLRSRLAIARHNEWFAFVNNVGTTPKDRGP